MTDLEEMTTQVERELLVALLVGGADLPSNLSDITSRHVQSVQERLRNLEDEGLVWNKGNGVYELTEEGTTTARAIRQEYDIVEDLEFKKPNGGN